MLWQGCVGNGVSGRPGRSEPAVPEAGLDAGRGKLLQVHSHVQRAAAESVSETRGTGSIARPAGHLVTSRPLIGPFLATSPPLAI